MNKGKFYNSLAFYYDFICGDRRRDVDILRRIIKRHKRSEGKKLLDVACGTGLEDKYLKKHYDVTGIDLNKGVLKLAKKRNPKIRYETGDMRKFRLKEKFDVITCFDAMGYLLNIKNLRMTLKNFYNHLEKGGVLVFYIDDYRERLREHDVLVTKKSKGKLHVTLIEDFHFNKKIGDGFLILVVRKGNKSKVFVDKHVVGVFSISEIKKILSKIGFKTYLYESDPKTTFTSKKYSGKAGPFFVCVKK